MAQALSIERAAFRALALEHTECAENQVIPHVVISRQIPVDLDTPVSALLKIRQGDFSFLLESVERGSQVGRYSFLGTTPNQVLTAKDGICTLEHPDGAAPGSAQACANPLAQLEAHISSRRLIATEGADPPIFSGGAVGYVGYEVSCTLEPVSPAADAPLDLPDLAFAFYDTILVFDHVQRTAQICTLAPLTPTPDREYDRATGRVEEVMRRLRQPVPAVHGPKRDTRDCQTSSNCTQAGYEQLVAQAQAHIAAGDIIQVVLSQRFERHTDADPFNIYRALRMINPSPYMFFLQFGDFYLVGASPEMLVKLHKGKVSTHPIAGTRRRGFNSLEDRQLELELLADEKEKAEHLMLVDLGRNDIGKIAKIGSVKVPRFMQVEHYSHVMHLVSEVEGEMREGLGPVDALRSCFPAGTVSGAAKVRAMQIISELEKDRRGTYAGAAGYIGYDGSMDTAITIRTIAIRKGLATVQAGAGIVADSVPASEYEETEHKARALISAIELAEQIEREEAGKFGADQIGMPVLEPEEARA
jgi:anthranilate synthase component I